METLERLDGEFEKLISDFLVADGIRRLAAFADDVEKDKGLPALGSTISSISEENMPTVFPLSNRATK